MKTCLIVPASIFFFIFSAPLNALAFESEGTLLQNSFRMIWGLLIVLGIILLLYALLKKRFSVLSSSSGQRIKIIEIKPIMQKKSLCIVEVDGEEYLLGICSDQIQPLATLSGKQTKSFSDFLQSTKKNDLP